MNIPATPPVRNAIRIADRSPPSRAAAATRTLPRTHSDMPVNPVSAENTGADQEEDAAAPAHACAVVGTGSSKSTKKMMTTNTPRVLNWRRRYAAAPSWMARAMSCIFWVPWLAASTSRTSTPATPSASSADDRDDDDPGQVGAAHADGVCRRRRDIPEHSTSWNSERKTLPIGTKRVAGSLRTREPNHEHRANPNNFVMFLLSSRYTSVIIEAAGRNRQSHLLTAGAVVSRVSGRA